MITRCVIVLSVVGGFGGAAEHFLSGSELEVVRYMNEARTHPAQFAARYIAPIHAQAARECVREMRTLRAMAPLERSIVLTHSAAAHAVDLGRTGDTSHEGSDGSNLNQRVERYGRWTGSIAENLTFGVESPLQIIVMLLIDEGVPSRGHRRNILNPKLRDVGVAIRPHRRFGTVCVQDFATNVVER